ncbi:MAG: HD domain-containing protein [Gemmatimonadetes bacterium]|nr:HD domain-containing protein [Gemmatimonadota bacterium]
MAAPFRMQKLKWLLFEHFEQLLVLLLVASLLVIHWLVDYKLAFLSFYYLPIIVAGFLVGRNTAVWAAVLIVNLVLFFQLVQGLEGDPGFELTILLTLVPWAGFLILTGYVVGLLAEQRQARLEDVKRSYVAMLELLTFSLEATEHEHRGHSHRVAELAGRLAKALALREAEVENVRVAALLHEVGPENPRLLALMAQFPGEIKGLPVAGAVRGATTVLTEYSRYYELVGDDWPVDQLPVSVGAKILAVADAYETLQLESPLRPALAPWTALAEIEKGTGRVFASEVVKVLRRVAGLPVRADREVRLEGFAVHSN